MTRASLLVALAWFALAIDVGGAQAQGAPPALPSLPDADALPAAPASPRLPGIDSRQCGTSKWSALCAVGRWAQFSAMDVTVRTTGFTAQYRLEQAANGELHATYREEVRGMRRGGEVVVFGVDGIAFRTRDELPPPDVVIDYMVSSPIMLSQLAAVLLDAGVLGPPSDVTRPLAIKAASETQYIRTEAPRAATLYGPPWSMTGTVRQATDGRIGFTLNLRFRPVDARGVVVAGKSDTIVLDGSVSYAPRRAALPDTLDLVGWKLMKRDVELRGVGTLDEARSAIGP